jgi:CHAD domain-containing protein
MGNHSEYQQRALDCLQKMQNAKSEADKRTWKMMADSWLLLRNFKQSAEQDLAAAKREVVALQDHIATKRNTGSKVARG